MEKVPNIISLLRVVLTIALNIYIVLYFGSILLPLLLTLLIFSTDIIDGKIARKFNAVTNFGAIVDFSADLFYITISYIVLCWYHILPWIGLLLILFKAIEFVITSLILRAHNPETRMLFFDYLGKTVAIILYIIPITAYLSFNFIKPADLYLADTIFYIIMIMALISSFHRIHLCFKICV